MNNLCDKLSKHIAEATTFKNLEAALANSEINRPYYNKTILDLPDIDSVKPEGEAIVVVGGPSLHRKKPIAKIVASSFKGSIITADGSLGYCLRNGLVPNYVISVDPDPLSHRIVRWFGDPDLDKRPEDDYFSRQDLDQEHWKNESRTNEELIELVNKYGNRIKAVIATCANPAVTKRCADSGMDLYWWNPLYDDYDQPDSITRKVFESNRIPCLTTGGNVGTSAWIIAHTILRKKNVALVGMDLSYAPGTSPLNTQYYYELVKLLGKERVTEAFVHIYNPYLKEAWFADPAYNWYRKVFLELAKEADCTTYNCTEGGVLFGDNINFIPLADFLSKFSNNGSDTKKGQV